MPGWLQKSWINSVMAGPSNVREYEDRNGAKFYKVTNEAKTAINNFYQKKWFLYRDDWSNKLDDILQSMEDTVRKYGAKLIILDNLMTIDLGTSSEDLLLKQTDCINRLIQFAMLYSTAVVLVAHPRKMQTGCEVGIYDVAGSANIQNLAHRTLALRRIQDSEGSEYDVCLSVVKDRLRGKAGKKINMFYDIPSRRFYTNEREYNHKYSWDTSPGIIMPYPHEEENEVYGRL